MDGQAQAAGPAAPGSAHGPEPGEAQEAEGRVTVRRDLQTVLRLILLAALAAVVVAWLLLRVL